VQFRLVPRNGSPVSAGSLRGHICNLNETGALLLGPLPDEAWSDELLDNHLLVKLDVVMPDAGEPPLPLQARCVWLEVGDAGLPLTAFGLLFESLSPADAKCLKRLLTRLQEISQ
jgi:hypothetical protein